MNLAETGVPLDSRSKYLRSLVIDGLSAGRGHVGSSLSLIEIIRVLYDDVLNVRPDQPDWADRDRFILSKGHGCLGLYSVLADRGFFSKENCCAFANRMRSWAATPTHISRVSKPRPAL